MKNSLILFILLAVAQSFSQQKKWTLQECVNHALEHNINILQNALSIEDSKENVVNAFGNFLPSLSGSASQSYNFGSFIDINGGRISRDVRSNSFGLNSGMTLFNGFRNTNTYAQAKLGVEISKLQLDILKNDIALNVANAYLGVLINKEQLRLSQDAVSVSEEQIKQLKELVELGVRAKAELFEVEAQLASNKQQLVASENSVTLSLFNLAQLLQLPHQGFDIANVDINTEAFDLVYRDSETIYNEALESRPEIKRAKLAIDDSELTVKIAKSSFYPTLNIGAGLGTSYQHNQGQKDLRLEIDPITGMQSLIPNRFFDQINNNLGYNVGLSLNIPIFNRLQVKTGVNRAKINQKRVALDLEQQKLSLRSNIEQAYLDAKASLNQYKASQSSVKFQEEAYNNAKERYQQDIITSFELEQVRNRYLNAQSSLIRSKYDFVFKTKILDFYMGQAITD